MSNDPPLPTVSTTGGRPMYNLDKLVEERGRLRIDLGELERTYKDAKGRIAGRILVNQENIDACRDILRQHEEAAE